MPHLSASFPIFFSLNLSSRVDSTFYKSVPHGDLGKTAAHRGLLCYQMVHLFVEASTGAVFTGTATLSSTATPGQTFLPPKLFNHDLQCSEMVRPGRPRRIENSRAVEAPPVALRFQDKRRCAGSAE